VTDRPRTFAPSRPRVIISCLRVEERVRRRLRLQHVLLHRLRHGDGSSKAVSAGDVAGDVATQELSHSQPCGPILSDLATPHANKRTTPLTVEHARGRRRFAMISTARAMRVSIHDVRPRLLESHASFGDMGAHASHHRTQYGNIRGCDKLNGLAANKTSFQYPEIASYVSSIIGLVLSFDSSVRQHEAHVCRCEVLIDLPETTEAAVVNRG
jgi:hypothetical protein